MDGSSDGLGVNAGELAAMVLRLSDMIGNLAKMQVHEQMQTREVLSDLLQNQKDLTALLGEHAKQIAALQAKLTQPTVQ